MVSPTAKITLFGVIVTLVGAGMTLTVSFSVLFPALAIICIEPVLNECNTAVEPLVLNSAIFEPASMSHLTGAFAALAGFMFARK
jgi:hypothetical protein